MQFLKTLYRYWMKLGHLLGTINSFIILTVVYLVLFGVYALPFKIMQRLKKPSKPSTYWTDKNKDRNSLTDAQFQF